MVCNGRLFLSKELFGFFYPNMGNTHEILNVLAFIVSTPHRQAQSNLIPIISAHKQIYVSRDLLRNKHGTENVKREITTVILPGFYFIYNLVVSNCYRQTCVDV